MPSSWFSLRAPVLWALLFLVPVLGLGTRANAGALPRFWALYAPDALWALLVFVVVAVLVPRLRAIQVAVIALAFSYSIELSQLYQAPWINAIRATRIGGLVLGYGFLWSDLVCYTVGVGCGFVLLCGLEKGANSGSVGNGYG